MTNSEEPKDESPDRVEESRVDYAPLREKEENMSMDDIKLIEHAARILQTSGDTATALRRAMRESIATNEATVPRSLSLEVDLTIDVEPNGVDALSVGPDDDIELSTLVSKVRATGESVIITRHGKPTARLSAVTGDEDRRKARRAVARLLIERLERDESSAEGPSWEALKSEMDADRP